MVGWLLSRLLGFVGWFLGGWWLFGCLLDFDGWFLRG